MKSSALSATHSAENSLLELFRAIAARDRKAVSKLLKAAPSLAASTIQIGATRGCSSDYFLDKISHYIYAGDTPLHVAAATYQRDIAEELVSLHANVSARNRRGAEPLHYAADGSPGSALWNPDAQYAVVEFLIKAGANPNCEDKSGVAPLHRAVRTRCTAAVQALLNNGADARRRNKSGSTPLHLAIQNTGRGSSGTAAAREQQAKIIHLLLDHGAQLSDKDSAGKSVEDCIKSDWIKELIQQS
jgi:hypothetical protein